MTDHNKDMARMAGTLHPALSEIPQPQGGGGGRGLGERDESRGGVGAR